MGLKLRRCEIAVEILHCELQFVVLPLLIKKSVFEYSLHMSRPPSAACLNLEYDVVKYAFELFEYKERHQHQSVYPVNFMREMGVGGYVGALVTGILDRCDAAQVQHADQRQATLAAMLELLKKFLDLWTDGCGLDFRHSSGYRSGSYIMDDDKDRPLVVSWRRRQDEGLPIVDVLLSSGYKPSCWLVVWSFYSAFTIGNS
jgi:hypothetical protein